MTRPVELRVVARVESRVEGEMAEPVGWLRAVVGDAADPRTLARVWQAVLGVGVVETAADWIQLTPDRGAADGPRGTPG